MFEDAITLFGLLALYGLVIGAITASLWHFIHKE
jgi:hypothetical protein